MFGADAFTEDVDVEGTNRKFSLNGKDYEIDFCSTLHVHEGLKIRDRPSQQMKKMRFLKGNWESWLEKLVQKYTQLKQEEHESEDSDLTPTKTSVRATHYIVGETKISLGRNSIIQRLLQLEKNVKMLCEKRGATAKQAPLKAVGIIALAGIGVPPKPEFDDKDITAMIKLQKKRFPILSMLLQEERVFVFEIDSFHVRLEQVEEGLEKVDGKLDAQGEKLDAQGEKLDVQGEKLEKLHQKLDQLTCLLTLQQEELKKKGA
jgi:hypothetical protein